jgi:hypothetical protein
VYIVKTKEPAETQREEREKEVVPLPALPRPAALWAAACRGAGAPRAPRARAHAPRTPRTRTRRHSASGFMQLREITGKRMISCTYEIGKVVT